MVEENIIHSDSGEEDWDGPLEVNVAPGKRHRAGADDYREDLIESSTYCCVQLPGGEPGWEGLIYEHKSDTKQGSKKACQSKNAQSPKSER